MSAQHPSPRLETCVLCSITIAMQGREWSADLGQAASSADGTAMNAPAPAGCPVKHGLTSRQRDFLSVVARQQGPVTVTGVAVDHVIKTPEAHRSLRRFCPSPAALAAATIAGPAALSRAHLRQPARSRHVSAPPGAAFDAGSRRTSRHRSRLTCPARLLVPVIPLLKLSGRWPYFPGCRGWPRPEQSPGNRPDAHVPAQVQPDPPEGGTTCQVPIRAGSRALEAAESCWSGNR
jgi:hypothetical protein